MRPKSQRAPSKSSIKAVILANSLMPASSLGSPGQAVG
jgi:hypothetical protein